MKHIKDSMLESPEGKPEKLGGKEKFEEILKLFGTDQARENFVKTCIDYIEANNKAAHESYAEAPSVRRRAVTSGPKQAIIHNKIMDALTRLASQAPEISPVQREVLREMYNRDVTAKIIRQYMETVGMVSIEENEEENEKKRQKMSDTAYYHSLGKEH